MKRCSNCAAKCRTPLACEVPLDEPPPRPSGESWGRAIGAVLGLAGSIYIAAAVARHLFF